MLRIDRGLRIVTIEAPTIWLPSLSEVARWVLKAAAILLAAWTLYAAGQSSMASVALDARGDADWCAGLLGRLVPRAEGAAAELATHTALQTWVLRMMDDRRDYAREVSR